MKLGQMFTIDLIIAVTIVLFGSVLLLQMLVPEVDGEQVQSDTSALAGMLYAPFPIDWNETTVIRPGFIIDHIINDTLLTQFGMLGENTIRDLAGIKSRFEVQIYNNTNDSLFITGTPPSVNATTIFVTKRYALYNGSLVRIEVVGWDE